MGQSSKAIERPSDGVKTAETGITEFGKRLAKGPRNEPVSSWDGNEPMPSLDGKRDVIAQKS
jgi:hypothetical protein